MYNPLLDTFVAVVDFGSFNKASEHLYISATAIMKQINTLENHLNIKLIERTPSGVKLTLAGEIIYHDALRMIADSKKTIAHANAVTNSYETTFCVGTSLLNPAKAFMDLWYQVNQSFPNYKLHLVSFEDNHEGILSKIEKLGEEFDFLIGVCDSKAWLSLCDFLPLKECQKMVAVSRNHPLATKRMIHLQDLYGETLMMVCEGDSGINDLIRHDFMKNHPQIKIEDTPQHYDLSVFNRCAETDRVLLTIDCWKDVHPGLVTIPVNWNYTIPYGILYRHHAPHDVQSFIKAVENITRMNR